MMRRYRLASATGRCETAGNLGAAGVNRCRLMVSPDAIVEEFGEQWLLRSTRLDPRSPKCRAEPVTPIIESLGDVVALNCTLSQALRPMRRLATDYCAILDGKAVLRRRMAAHRRPPCISAQFLAN
jgi:hypothetical protein